MENIIFFNNQKEFSDWLGTNNKLNEIWVGYYKKSSKKRADRTDFTWSESVDVALCFGWIDGIRKTIDADRYKIRFTPRKITSVWSSVNVKKVEQLIKSGKMRPAGLYLFNNRTDKEGYSSESRNIPLSEKYEAEIKVNQEAWLFLSNLAPSYKRESIWWVMSAKREDTRLKRLGILIESSEAGLRIPMLRSKK